MHYLVSVIDDKIGSPGPADMAAIGAYNDRLKATGHWVFAGGLEAPSAATVIDNRGDEAALTDGPFLETKEYIVGFWIIERPTPRRGAQTRGRGVEGLRREGRGAPVPGRRVSVIDVREAITRAHHEEWALVVAALTRRFGDLDIAEEAAAEAFATAVERWPADGVPPNPAAPG